MGEIEMEENDSKRLSEEGNDFFTSGYHRPTRSSAGDTTTGSLFARSKGKEIRIPDTQGSPTNTLNIPPASVNYDSVFEDVPAQNTAQNQRVSISTNRIFSPYDFSFFEEPVTTRELSASEKKRMDERRTRNSNTGSITPSAFAKADALMSEPKAQPVSAPSETRKETTKASGFVLTPENNMTPEEGGTFPPISSGSIPTPAVKEPEPASNDKTKIFDAASVKQLSSVNAEAPRVAVPDLNPELTRKTEEPSPAVVSPAVNTTKETTSSQTSAPEFSIFSDFERPSVSSTPEVEQTVVIPSVAAAASTKKDRTSDTKSFFSLFEEVSEEDIPSSKSEEPVKEAPVHSLIFDEPVTSDASGRIVHLESESSSPVTSGRDTFRAEPEIEKTRPISREELAEQAERVAPVTKSSEQVSKKPRKVKKNPSGDVSGSSTGPNGGSNRNKTTKTTTKKGGRGLKIVTAILIFCILLEVVAGVIGLNIFNRMISTAPDLNLTDFVGEESTKIYDDSGELITEVGVYLRENITYDKCPESLVDAFLSIEDSRFFSHFGFDIPRFSKAIIDNLKTRSFGQGGSTFTMQLVKNTYFSVESMDANDTGTERTRDIEYKVQQIYLAIKLETLLTKKEIFQLYLNKLNFGGNVRGVQRASQYYFGKECNELNLAESAMLAGIVNLPNRYNPYQYLDYGTDRRDTVLDLMCMHGYITEEERDLAKKIKVEDLLAGDQRKASENSEYQSYLDVVLEEAVELTGVDPTVKGMQIYTYLNRDMQEQVEAIQNEETSVVFPDELMQVAMISMNNHTGAIIAVGGGRNYDGARLLNRATMNYKQPGSSVKPLLSYGLAFEYLGYSLDEVLLDKPITYPLESMVLVNASGNYNGDVTIKDAVGNSLNIPAIVTLERVVNKVGAQKVVDYLHTIGFSHVKAENFHLSYAIGGTTFETTCKELAGAHSMLINSGVYNKPHTIDRIVMTSDGSVYLPDGQNVRALSSGSAYLATVLEENNVTGPYFNYMQVLRRSYPVYAKTGTTDWGNDGVQYGIPKGQKKDKWMVASSSEYTNCVWVGYDMAVAGKETYYTSYKSSLNIPGNINRLLLDKEEELFGVPDAIERPEDVVDSTYIYGTFPHVRPEYAIDGGGTVTSLVSKAGLESMPLATVDEFLEYQADEATFLGTAGFSASFDQFGILTVSWGNAAGICSGGERNISLHDPYNDIDQWGACLADLSWLAGGGEYWGTVFVDDMPVGEISSENGYFTGYVADLFGEVKVCGGSATADGSDNTACVVATYKYNENANGYVDEFGNWIPLEIPEYEQYGYWDANGAWVGQGYWDENGFHL